MTQRPDGWPEVGESQPGCLAQAGTVVVVGLVGLWFGVSAVANLADGSPVAALVDGVLAFVPLVVGRVAAVRARRDARTEAEKSRRALVAASLTAFALLAAVAMLTPPA